MKSNRVNFELAKMLKEKGFPQLNQGLYYTKDKNHCLVGWGFNTRDEGSFAQYSAPTIAQVLAWLYEEHGIWIEVKRFTYKLNTEKTIFKKEVFTYMIKDVTTEILYPTQSEAYESGIEYCLIQKIS